MNPWRMGHASIQAILPLSPGFFLMLAPTWWVWMNHLVPTSAGSVWTPHLSLPLRGIRIGTMSLFTKETSYWSLNCTPWCHQHWPFLNPFSCHLSLPVPTHLPLGVLLTYLF